MFRHILTLQQVSRRQISSTVRRQLPNKVPEKQKLFQLLQVVGLVSFVTSIALPIFEANGMPVHLKGGVSDAVLYRATMGLTVMGTACVIYELLMAAVPQKKD